MLLISSTWSVANHFQEWRTDYHHETLAWSLRHHGTYPTETQRRRWLRAYVEQGRLVRMRSGRADLPSPSEMALPPPLLPPADDALARLDASIEKEVDRLEREVRIWSPATHAVWGVSFPPFPSPCRCGPFLTDINSTVVGYRICPRRRGRRARPRDCGNRVTAPGFSARRSSARNLIKGWLRGSLR